MACDRNWINVATPGTLDVQILVNGTVTVNGGIVVTHPITGAGKIETELPLSALPITLSPNSRYEVITAFAAVGNGGTVTLIASVTGATSHGPEQCILSVKDHVTPATQTTTVTTV